MMRSALRAKARFGGLFLLLLALASCTSQSSFEAKVYANKLALSVRSADRIVITEHSNIQDLVDSATEVPLPKDYEPQVYATHEMSPSERDQFVAELNAINTDTFNAEPACIFEPHHTITFYQGDKPPRKMVICFQCGQIHWDGVNEAAPRTLYKLLEGVVTRAGMHPVREWWKLAK